MNRAVCILIERDGAILGVSRKGNPGAFGLPGGNVQAGELPRDALIRLLKKETGFQVQASPTPLIHRAVEPTSGIEVLTFTVDDPGGSPAPADGEGLCSWVGWPALMAGPFASYNAEVRAALAEESTPTRWAMAWGSGSLRRAIEEGLRWNEMYLGERVALEFGYGFEAVPDSRLTIGSAIASSDDSATTETCWWARALRWRSAKAGRKDVVAVLHVTVSDGDGGSESGMAILMTPEPRPSWLPADRKLVAITVGKDGRTVNPC